MNQKEKIMRKKILSIFICLSLLALQPQIYAAQPNPSKQTTPNILPYLLIEAAAIVGGTTACVIGYHQKAHCNKKVELLQDIERYCKRTRINPNDLSSNKILLFAQNLHQEHLLKEIINNQETQETLTSKEFWNNLLLWGGGAAAGAGLLGLIATIALHLSKKSDKTKEDPKKTLAKELEQKIADGDKKLARLEQEIKSKTEQKRQIEQTFEEDKKLLVEQEKERLEQAYLEEQARLEQEIKSKAEQKRQIEQTFEEKKRLLVEQEKERLKQAYLEEQARERQAEQERQREQAQAEQEREREAQELAKQEERQREKDRQERLRQEEVAFDRMGVAGFIANDIARTFRQEFMGENHQWTTPEALQACVQRVLTRRASELDPEIERCINDTITKGIDALVKYAQEENPALANGFIFDMLRERSREVREIFRQRAQNL